MRTFFTVLLFGFFAPPTGAALLDVWQAEDLNTLNDGDLVGTWNSASNRTAAAAAGVQPVLKKNATPGGTSVVRFTQDLMNVPNSPVGGRTAFSVAIVFKADAAGANGNAQWYGKTGLVDAEEGGVTSDWGTVITETGRVGIGTGNPDISTYGGGVSLVDSNFHVGVFTWGSGIQTVYVNGRAPISQSGVSTAPRNNARLAFGGIATSEGGANRRFVGDLAEVRFYNTALTGTEASNVVAELTDRHIVGGRPVIRSFAASTNLVLLSNAVTLSWDVTNATAITIEPGVGTVPGPNGSVQVFPNTATTYTLTASNALGSRSAQVTVMVDPGIPVAYSQSVTTLQNVARPITLTGADPNGGTLSYAIVLPPQQGALSGAPPAVTYMPTMGFFGNDSFTFKVNDGSYDSLPATIFVRVNHPPAAPSAIILSTTNINENAGPGSFLAGLTSIDVNPEETHTFTLVPGFGNNALFTINGNLLLAGPGFAGGVGAAFTIRIRDTDSASLALEQTFTLRVVEVLPGVVINEVHYNSPLNTVREEFIELHNTTAAPVDLSFWSVRGGIDYTFPQGTIIALGGFVVIAQDAATIQSRYGVMALGPWTGAINNEGERVTLRDADNNIVDEVEFRSEFPWPIAANGGGASMQLVHPSLDNNLGSSWRSGPLPTPGVTNGVFAANAAPNLRQVNHSPQQPASTNLATITCKVTDPEGVASVQLRYQVVAPGNYIPATLPLTAAQLNSLNTNPNQTNALNPAFEAATNWTTVLMTDDGMNGDELAGDTIYTVVLPPQANRTLVRYRITVTDALSAARRAPFEDDPSLNFAYFVYDGLPFYQGFSPAVLGTLPVYTLITRNADLNQCTAWFSGGDQLSQTAASGARHEGRLHFNWEGAVVYDGVVYDHVTYRLRGANGRYHPGKRSFRIRFRDGHLLEAKDESGQRFPTRWRELTTGKGQSNRGSEQFALNEVINYFLFNKVGVPAPSTFHFHFRVVRGTSEAGTDRYSGDFWGLNWAQEKYDVNFLEAHGLPKGNLYKLVDNFVLGVDERRYQASFAPTNAADFFNIQNNLTGSQSMEWLLAHVNYTNWYRYHAVAEAIRHYDIWPSANKNGSWYFEPIYTPANNYLGRMMTLPYDTTDTWGPTWNGGQDVVHNGIFNDAGVPGGDPGQNLELQKEYRIVVREVRDLLFQPDQIVPLIDAFAGRIRNVAAADLVRWSAAPAPASYNSLFIPGSPGVTGGLPGYAQDLKNFMFVGGNSAWWIDRTSVGAGGWVTRLDQLATDTAAPNKPVITYVGPMGFPLDGLLFQTSAFSDPQGNNTFAALQWRVAEITPTNTPVSDPAQVKLEWDAVWDSGERTNFANQINVPGVTLLPGHFYRARVRHKDNTGRWSRWSDALPFVATPADVVGELRTSLVFSEIMYNPPGQDSIDGDEFEFLELENTGTNTLNLSALFFSAGIDFTFTNGTLLSPGATFLLGRNAGALQSRYPSRVVNGIYSGKLDNDGETITLRHPQGFDVLSVTYADAAPWPVTADGLGFSLVLTDAAAGLYRASSASGGSPGTADPPPVVPAVVINEVLTSSAAPAVDAIELYNATGAAADLSGWYLSDDAHYPWKYRFPNGTMLPAGGYLVVTETNFNPTPGVGASFALSSLGDDVYLFSGNTALELTGYAHGFQFGGAATGVSFGRYVNGTGAEQFPAQSALTFGANNAGPRVGPVVINEIHYHPGPSDDEFVEMLNITGHAVKLFDEANPMNRWQFGGVGYTFPANATLGPSELVLLVAIDPAVFRARYQVPASVQVFGPVSGNLQDSGERLELQAPEAPTTNGVPYFDVDDVRYNDRLPWPTAADGAGASLQRRVSDDYGNDPTNWTAAVPTPGLRLPLGARPTITSQPADRTVVAFQTATFGVAASGAAPLFYQWRFDNNLRAGATNSTLTLSNVQANQAGNYSVDIFNAFGSTTSERPALTVLIPAYIIQPPQSQRVGGGSNAIFTVVASSRTPFTYQWRRNGLDLPGATNATLTLTNVQLSDAGDYAVVITDAVGPVLSPSASLTVLVRPTITLQPLSQTVVSNATVAFTIAASGTPPISFRWRRNNLAFTNALFLNTPTTATLLLTNVKASDAAFYNVAITNIAGAAAGLSSNAVLTVLADSDADGIPDDLEPLEGATDLDGDGLSNAAEYFAGTDPFDSASYLKIAIEPSGPATLTLNAVSNRTYSVQYTEGLNPILWKKLADVLARSTSRREGVVDPAGSTNRYYRLVTPIQP